jgi:hypothetical protein
MALFLTFFFTLMNHGLGLPVPAASYMRYAIIVAATFSVFGRGKSSAPVSNSDALLWATAAIVFMMLMHALIISPVTDISLLKTILFGTVALTLLAAWSWQSAAERRLTETMLFHGLAAIAISSIPLVVHPFGYMRNNVGFQGVMVHPQNFGPAMSVLASVLFGKWLSDRRGGYWIIGLVALCVTWIFLSKARVGLMSVVGGVVGAMVIHAFQSAAARAPEHLRIRPHRLALLAAACIAAAVFAGPVIATKTVEFIRKGRDADEALTESAVASRVGLIDRMMVNIQLNPLTGIGFGIASFPEERGNIGRDPFLGLPVLAPVEKGVMPVAIMEELGVPLATLLFIWMAVLGLRSARGGLAPLAGFLAAMFTNLAEATFFSPGGMGLMMLVVISWAATSPRTELAHVSPRRTAKRQRLLTIEVGGAIA